MNVLGEDGWGESGKEDGLGGVGGGGGEKI